MIPACQCNISLQIDFRFKIKQKAYDHRTNLDFDDYKNLICTLMMRNAQSACALECHLNLCVNDEMSSACTFIMMQAQIEIRSQA